MTDIWLNVFGILPSKMMYDRKGSSLKSGIKLNIVKHLWSVKDYKVSSWGRRLSCKNITKYFVLHFNVGLSMTLSIDRKLPNLAQRHIYSNSLYFTFICVATQPHHILWIFYIFWVTKQKIPDSTQWVFLTNRCVRATACTQKLGSGVCKV